MDLMLRWFIYLCLEKKLLQLSTFNALRKTAKISQTASAYGEMLLEVGIIPDRAAFQSLLDEARAHAKTNKKPPMDPFAEPGAATEPEPDQTPPPAKSNLPPALSPSDLHSKPETPSIQAPSSAPAPKPPAASTERSATAAKDTTAPKEARPRDVIEVGAMKAGLPDFSALQKAAGATRRESMIALLRHTIATGASDLHLSAGARPFVRRDREIEYIASEPLSAEGAEELNRALLTDSQWEILQQNQDLDFALPFSTGERFRVNLMIHRDGCAGTYRAVPPEIRSLADLGFRNPETIDKLLSYHNGLIMVTGPVGSGKTTTLAALVQQLNQTRNDHLISVESPIEFVHSPDHCIITQRGVGQHTNTFHSALKGALRQDPDIIVIGEMRDLETIEMAISASETGHLVIGTMHTSDAATTLNRLLDVFPPAQQSQIRAMVAESLRGIICQRLLPAKKGGLVLASEVLIRNTAVSALIREGKTQGLGNIMETGKTEGMIAMDSSILELWRAGKISDEVALSNIRNEIIAREIRKPAATPPPANSPTAPETPKKRGIFNLKR